MDSAAPGRNWSGTIAYQARALLRPTSLDELRALVTSRDKVRALGSRHSFSRVADTVGDLVDLSGLGGGPELDTVARTVRLPARLRYGELTGVLDAQGWALPNLGSLPHITVAGAAATGTHGGGDHNRLLGTAISALTLLTASGDLVTYDRDHPDFDGVVLSLGALGIITELTLDLVPAFEMRQWVYRDLPTESLVEHLDEIMASAYSVSLFTDWAPDVVRQVWFKRRAPVDNAPPVWFGAILADRPMHPVPGVDPAHCTQQLGVVGPWHQRLPHFRLEFTPSHGDEVQSEYLVPRRHGREAVRAMIAIGPRIGSALQVGEIRTVAADSLWLSPAFAQDSLALHFTWVPDAAAVASAVDAVEGALLPLGARPHWGKVFRAAPARYPRGENFAALRHRLDPTNRFGNDFVDEIFGTP